MTTIPFPHNLFQFGRMFNSEEACRDYLIRVRWPEGFRCFCGSQKGYWIAERKAFECAQCGEWTYLTQGTVMEKSSTPICIWFLGAYLVTTVTPGISAVQFQRQAGLSRYETAFQILHKLRSAMVRPERGRLSGKVEADETFIGGKEEGRVGRGVINKTLVAGAVEVRRNAREHAGRVRLRIVPDGSAKSLLSFILDNVDPGSTVVTDGWPSYNNLSRRGYRHFVAEGADLGGIPRVGPHAPGVQQPEDVAHGHAPRGGEREAPTGVPERVYVPVQPQAGPDAGVQYDPGACGGRGSTDLRGALRSGEGRRMGAPQPSPGGG